MNNNELLHVFPTAQRFLRNTYDVGLLNLDFTSIKSSTEPAARRVRSAVQKPLFPGEKKDSVQHVRLKKETSSLLSFFSTFSKLVQQYGIKPVAATISSPPHVDLFIEIESTITDANTYVLLPVKLANLFKLSQRQLWKGSLFASGFASQIEFDDIPMNTEFDIQIVTSNDLASRIVCTEQIECMFVWRAPPTISPEGFFTKLSQKFFDIGFSVTFDFSNTDNCRVSVHSLLQNRNDYIVIPTEIADALGLETTILTSGLHESSQPFQGDKFNLIKEGQRFWFGFTRYYTTIYNMSEPVSQDYEHVLEAINMSLNEGTLPNLRIKFQYEDGELVLSIGPDTLAVTLPKAVNKFYEFPARTSFHIGTRMSLPKIITDEIKEQEIERGEKGITPTPERDDSLPPKHVLVKCNIVDTSIVAGRSVRTLAVLHNILQNKNAISWSADPVLYLRLNSEHVYYLKLRLFTEKDKPLKLDPNSETTASIIFRQRV